MPRIAGVDIPEKKRIDIALTYLYGVGRVNVAPILKRANVDPAKRTHELTVEEVARLQKMVDGINADNEFTCEIKNMKDRKK
mgnify:CR=1 FL=1